jgi:hypothetical protein
VDAAAAFPGGGYCLCMGVPGLYLVCLLPLKAFSCEGAFSFLNRSPKGDTPLPSFDFLELIVFT